MPITGNINDNWLWEGPDGREAWILFSENNQVFIATDIHNQGQPYNAVPFTPDILRRIADECEVRQADM